MSPLTYLTIFILSNVIMIIISVFHSIENKIFVLIVVILTIIMGYYYYAIDIDKMLKKTDIDVKVKPRFIQDDNEVFHVSDNKYTYKDAKRVCGAYGSRLANWREIEKAYKNGAEWCGYGWSDDQMALFPTQYKTWNKLQTISGHEHDCGRPGINGGYIDNPNVKFGANCYGNKPPIKMSTTKKIDVTYVSPEPDIDDSLYVGESWLNKLSEAEISPFNRKRWSM